MRFIVMAGILAFGILAAASVQAQQSTTRNFGSTTCTQQVPCAGADITTLAANANSCFSQSFGFSNPQGMFDEASGLDANSCLTPRDNTIPKGVGPQLAPHCCLVQVSDTVCTFNCQLVQALH